ncbi:MAG: NAD(+)/NADH kinase [Elusimicrobia bacterium]|nr:NAD(+)/NADH kinase [Elusimicrobiota bacterium]
MIKIFANRKLERVRKVLPQVKKILKNFKTSLKKAYFVFGGDGFLLKTLSEIYTREAKVYFFPLGENSGIKGFKLKEIEKILENKIKTRKIKLPYLVAQRHRAFNDIVIRTGKIARTAKFKISCGRKEIFFEGDGVIISTPLGSGAYNFAAGGPQISIEKIATIITPLVVFKGWGKSIVTKEDSVNVEILKKQGDVWICFDGRNFIPVEKRVKIRRKISKCEFVLKND